MAKNTAGTLTAVNLVGAVISDRCTLHKRAKTILARVKFELCDTFVVAVKQCLKVFEIELAFTDLVAEQMVALSTRLGAEAFTTTCKKSQHNTLMQD